MIQYGYTISPPIPSDPADVAKQQLHVFVSPATAYTGPATLDTPTGKDWPEIVITEGASVTLTVTDMDSAGNESLPSPALVFTVIDDIPPATPGAPVVTSHRKIIGPDPSPVPRPTP